MREDPLIRSVDPEAVRHQLSRRNPAEISAHFLWCEAANRMKDRLSYIRVADGLHIDHGIAQFGRALGQSPASAMAIYSVGLLAYLSDARATLAYWAQMLRPGGLLMFCTLGPESFRSLALALNDPDQSIHVPGYPDMHDLGDALTSLGMADPVMDAERITLSYSSAESALDDLRALGGNPLIGRARGCRGRSFRKAVLAALDGLRTDGVIPIRIELVFGHAWAREPRPPKADVAPIRWAAPGSR